MAKTLASLEKEYCPPLDSALLSAILSDYDLSDPAAVKDARKTLDSIKASADLEDSTLFDPSGSANFNSDDIDEGNSDASRRSHSKTPAGHSEDTSSTSLSNGFSSLDLEDEKPGLRTPSEYESMDEATMLKQMMEMFPGQKEVTILFTLRKCNGQWTRALEELLNHEFFDNTDGLEGKEKILSKGIDAFAQEQAGHRGRAKKGKKNRKLIEDEARWSASLPAQEVGSPWEKAKKDIELLSSLTGKPAQSLSALYHQNGASISKTVVALIHEQLPSKQTSTLDPVVEANAYELGRDFPTIAPDILAGMIRLTYPSTAKAHELAKSFVARPHPGRAADLTPVYKRYVPEKDPPSSSIPIPSAPRNISNSDPAALAQSYRELSSRAFSSASSAHRRGKSDRLMSSAAGYYSQVGHEMATQRDAAISEAAEALVDSQSSPSAIDLHGVSVKDAVRIARARTEAWWCGRGVKGLDGRKVRDGDGVRQLSIITGVGRHSAGGRAKIGPAVGRMLVQEGWIFGIDEGVFTVTGKRR